MACLMRKPGRTDHVADGVEAGDAGAAPFVDDDMAFVDLDALLLEAEPLDIAGDADGEDDAVDGEFTGQPGLRQARRDAVVMARSRPSTVVPVWMVMPCLAKDLRASAEISASSAGRMRSSISTTVTSAPSVR